MGDPSRFDKLIASMFAGLPIGRIYPPKFTAMTKAHHSIELTIPACCKSKNTGARAAEIGMLSTTAEITPMTIDINGIEKIRGASRNGLRNSPSMSNNPKISIEPTRRKRPMIK